jgi:hypothetical protein
MTKTREDAVATMTARSSCNGDVLECVLFSRSFMLPSLRTQAEPNVCGGVLRLDVFLRVSAR